MTNVPDRTNQMYFDSTVYCYPGNEYLDFEIVPNYDTQTLSEATVYEELSIVHIIKNEVYTQSKQLIIITFDKIGNVTKIVILVVVVIIGLKNSHSHVYAEAFFKSKYDNMVNFTRISIPNIKSKYDNIVNVTNMSIPNIKSYYNNLAANFTSIFMPKYLLPKRFVQLVEEYEEIQKLARIIYENKKRKGNQKKSIIYDPLGGNMQKENSSILEIMDQLMETNRKINDRLNRMELLLESTNSKLEKLTELQNLERSTELVDESGAKVKPKAVKEVEKKETWKEFIKRNLIKYSKWTAIYIIAHILIPSSKD